MKKNEKKWTFDPELFVGLSSGTHEIIIDAAEVEEALNIIGTAQPRLVIGHPAHPHGPLSSQSFRLCHAVHDFVEEFRMEMIDAVVQYGRADVSQGHVGPRLPEDLLQLLRFVDGLQAAQEDGEVLAFACGEDAVRGQQVEHRFARLRVALDGGGVDHRLADGPGVGDGPLSRAAVRFRFRFRFRFRSALQLDPFAQTREDLFVEHHLPHVLGSDPTQQLVVCSISLDLSQYCSFEYYYYYDYY